MRLTMVFLLLIVSSTLSISGCGNKGPLYLPQEEPVEQTGQPASEKTS
ncbi:MAG: lipoprotein [Pseudomonadales bacterium]|nr:lipoprotein [Pseudomonadales bacterium]MCP5170968.1 lipoprotein [Pseudomonadales bacterium]MCP5301794.1 lipoprotein [Pseudomonadales bacterium]